MGYSRTRTIPIYH